MAARYQVAIVGGGPVGMALAVELGQRGISVAVVERGREVGRLPKGQSLHARTLEHFYFWNCLHEIRTIRLLPPGYPIGGVSVYGNLLSEYVDSNNSAFDATEQYYFQERDRLPQYLTEEVLRGRVAQLPNVTVMFERVAKRVDQDESGVSVTVSSNEWPYEEEQVDAEYVVACDGTGSVVREQLGIKRVGTDLGMRMVLAVFSSPEFHAATTRFGRKTTFRVVDPEMRGAWEFWGRVEAEDSFFYHGPVAEGTRPEDRDYVQGVMERAAGFPFAAEYQHIGFWNLRIAVAETYGIGRVFIAGDAAHAHPPYGGQGLNNGLEDVTNLGWKLAAVLKGWGGSQLLESYSKERQPIFSQIGEERIAGGILRDRAWLEEHNPERDLADFEKAWREQRDVTEGFNMEPHFAGSPVVCGEPGAEIGIHSEHAWTARAGHHLAPSKLSTGLNVFEALGPDFTLLAFDADEDAIGALERAASVQGMPLKVVRDSAVGELARYGASLVLVRPDQHVAWSDNGPETDPQTIIKRVVGAA